jgi:hypothetical protein
MISTQRWRDRQLSSFNKFSQNTLILKQEQLMLDFISSCGDIGWRWHGDNNQFRNICEENHTICTTEYQGIIIFGIVLNGHSTRSLITHIRNLIENVNYAYVGINRYTLTKHDLPIELPDKIDDSLDTIMTYCHPKFQRLYTFPEVDGNHMIAAHPMDCYGLCK